MTDSCKFNEECSVGIHCVVRICFETKRPVAAPNAAQRREIGSAAISVAVERGGDKFFAGPPQGE
jgi:hypothetical protein